MSRRSFGHIRKLPSGKHQASYIGESGERKYAKYTFLTRGDASAWLSEREVELRNGTSSASTKGDAGEMSPLFEEYVERHINLQTTANGELLRPSTKSLYRRLLRVNLRAFCGSRMNDISVSDVSEWWAEAISDGKRTSASKAYKLLAATMRRAVGERLIASSPCMVKGAQSATSGKKILAPTFEEVALIARHINPRFSRMVLLMAFGGFRFGEVTELRRKDVGSIQLPSTVGVVSNKEAFEFSVERAVTLVEDANGDFVHHIDRPKSTAGVRKVVVSSAFNEMIRDILAAVPEDPGALLFPSASNPSKHQRHDVFMNSWRPALIRAGIPSGKYSPHTLRHFAGSQLHLAGANIPELKEWLGDSSTAAVMRYVHPTGRTALISEEMGQNWQLEKVA